MPLLFEKLVQEDLNVGTDTVWVQAPGGGKLLSTRVGMHSFARGQVEYESAWTPGAITAGSKVSTTVTVADAAVADYVWASHDKVLTSDLRVSAHVSAANTVKVVIHNPTTSSVTVAAGTLRVLSFGARETAAPLVPFTLSASLSVNLTGLTFSLAATDPVLTAGEYADFGIAADIGGPFAATMDLACPPGDKTVYVQGLHGGANPLVLSTTVELTDLSSFCP